MVGTDGVYRLNQSPIEQVGPNQSAGQRVGSDAPS
jgi:hypothetical protein